MAVKTLLQPADVAHLARAWNLPGTPELQGIPQGSVNTLYVVRAGADRYVLRLSEGRSLAEVTFEAALLQHLEAARFPSIRLIPTMTGAAYDTIAGRPACLFQFAEGAPVRAGLYTPAMARESGRVLGRLHEVTKTFDATLPNRNGPGALPAWVSSIRAQLAERRSDADAEVVAFLPELELAIAGFAGLPSTSQGLIHADWFPDNLHWVGERISAALDFEMACRGPLMLDLAIALHAGCFGQGSYDLARVRPFVEGYRSERDVDAQELAAFPAWARFAAARFTTSRILDFHLSPLDASRLVKKDWRRFRDRFRLLRDTPDDTLRAAWGLG